MNRNPNLEGDLPRVPRLIAPPPNEKDHPDQCEVRRCASNSTSCGGGTSADCMDAVEGESRPGAEVWRAARRRGEIADTRRGSAPISITEYIETSNRSPMIDAFRFHQLRKGLEGMLVIKIARGNRRVRSHEECWRLCWLHWKNRPKDLRLEIAADMLWARQDHEFKYAKQMYALL